ncbi:MAG: hypothetical protein D8M57_05765 [Candidatus Scalindua sp. AMX11]|nr:MAG: hypothetical protein DWQ00_02130 [Candidatus Scalindua sp.]NOG82846.1 hypothetical protein [Planctomycetota bacterium]RZV86192.1 MAG: hypothetical protein EX341_07435 [Candidatus Scalindua sp. SCAELEC01]TDE65812.1 MAG: hypothetical protein D8M57_05765 [Candidatus Scalindua sp. AMX11]GJQ58317.1 MAG: hypothetical protein SCALA701_11180 [Candidatus Scalindua sp.]
MQILKPYLFVILALLLSLSTSISAEEDSSSLLKGFNFSTERPSFELIESSFDDLYKIFGKSRTISDAQVEALWKEYQGKYVRWEGIVTYKGIGEQDWKRVGIRHNVGTNVEILFDDDKKRIVGMIDTMDRITYTGKLSQFFDRNLIFEVVNATIEKINGVPTEELIEKQLNSVKLSSRETIDTNSDEPSTSAFDAGDAPEETIDFTFDEIDSIFGKFSRLSFDQKEKLWEKYEGKSVQWRGVVTYKSAGETNLNRIGVSHTTGTNIELVIDEEKEEVNTMERIKSGDDITYAGVLAKLFGRNLLCSVINVEILKIGDKPFLVNTVEESTQPETSQEKIDETEVVVADSMAPKAIKKEELGIVTDPEGFIKTSFEELEAIFGNESRLTESQKDKLWREYQGKRVRWQGKVVNRGLGRVSGLRMGVSHTDITDVELCFDVAMEEKVLSTNAGDMITYTGKLVKRRGYILPYRIENGSIEHIQAAEQPADAPQ